MVRTFSVFLLGFSVFIFSCGQSTSPNQEEPDQGVRELSQAEKNIVEAGKTFGLKLFRNINAEQEDLNVFISPLSVSMALGMTMNGADNATYDAMRQTLEFSGLTEEEINKAYLDLITYLVGLDEDVLFEIANSIWYKNTFEVENLFLQTNRDYFDAEVSALDFSDPASVDIINGWVNDKTHGKIETIIDVIHPLTVMFLINAIYFKGTWTYEFDPDNTVDEIFYQNPQQSIPCKMMKIDGIFDYYEDDDVQIVDLPYGDGKYSMTIVLPERSTDVNTFISNLTQEDWESYLAALDPDSGSVHMPKYKIEYELKMNDILIDMGMGIAFSGSADFSRINPVADLFISLVKHKSFIQTDEQGTEAAAVTLVEIRETSAQDPPKVFFMRMDRPFFFVIRERNSNAMLFMGKVYQPDWS